MYVLTKRGKIFNKPKYAINSIEFNCPSSGPSQEQLN